MPRPPAVLALCAIASSLRPAQRRSQIRTICMRTNPSSFAGTDMTITEYPHPVLRRQNSNITEFDDAFRQTCSEMMGIMYLADGVGLAATQVGLAQRFFVMNPTGNKDRKDFETVCVNPRIFEYSEKTLLEEEACLSSRSESCGGLVRRAEWIWVEYQDAEGKLKRQRLKGFEARVFQHEFDHIEGILHFDRLDAKDRARIQPELDELVDAYGEGGELERLNTAELVPPRILAGRMPAADAAPKKAKAKKAKALSGFGGAKAPAKRKKR